MTIRLAEGLSARPAALMSYIEDLVYNQIICFVFVSYWFKPLLYKLLGANKESKTVVGTERRVDLLKPWSRVKPPPPRSARLFLLCSSLRRMRTKPGTSPEFKNVISIASRAVVDNQRRLGQPGN